MSRLSQLEKFTTRGLAADLAVVEGIRKQLLQKLMILAAVYLIGAVVVAVVTAHMGSAVFIFLVQYSFLGIAFMAFGYPRLMRQFRREFKQRIVTRVVAWRDASFTYEPEGYFSEATFRQSRLHPGSYTTYRGEDMVMGKLDRTAIGFSDLNVIRGSGKNQATVFKGLFLMIETPATAEGSVVVMPDIAERFLGGLGTTLQRMQSARGNHVPFEDPAFEKVFVVYSDNEAEARRFLTAGMRRKLLALREEVGRDLQFSFNPAHVYVGAPNNPDAFEPKLFSATTPELLLTYVESLEFAMRLVKALRPEGSQTAS